MKRLIMILTVLTLCLGGCGNTVSNTNDSISEINTTSSDIFTEESNYETNELKTEISTIVSQETVQYSGVEMVIPAEFKDENIYGNPIHTKNTIYGNVHIDYKGYIDPDLEEVDLVEFLNSIFYYDFHELYDEASSMSFEMSNEKEEESSMLNFPAKKITGKINYTDNENDLYYTAYYSQITLKRYGDVKIPMLWIAFGDNNDENIVEIENAIELFAGSAKEY